MKEKIVSYSIYGGFGSIIMFLTCTLVGENLIDSIIISSIHLGVKPLFELINTKNNQTKIIESKQEIIQEISKEQQDKKKSLKYSSNR